MLSTNRPTTVFLEEIQNDTYTEKIQNDTYAKEMVGVRLYIVYRLYSFNKFSNHVTVYLIIMSIIYLKNIIIFTFNILTKQ